MRLVLLLWLVVGLRGETVISLSRPIPSIRDGVGVVVLSKEGLKIADVSPGFSYFSGTGSAQLIASQCSTNHQISEEPTVDAQGRYVLRMRPNPAFLAVYRGGVRLDPTTQYRLVYLEDGKLPDRFELTAAAPTSGKVLVDYTIGTSVLN